MTTRFSLFIVLFLFAGVLTSFDKEKLTPLTAKSIQQNMVKVSDELYACKYEVSNLEYRNFLDYLKIKDASLAEKYKVDTAKWITPLRYQEPMATYYHRHPAYNDYPVVGISYEAALAYCKWLTEQYNADPKRKFFKVEFMLPTEEQWMNAASGGNDKALYAWTGNYMRKRTGEYLCNFRHIGDAFIVADSLGNPTVSENSIESVASSLQGVTFYTASVRSFWPNKLGIYNVCGNAAEMTKEKGLTKGGSWNSFGGDVTIQSKKFYNESSTEVGFRVFMRIENHD